MLRKLLRSVKFTDNIERNQDESAFQVGYIQADCGKLYVFYPPTQQ
jgi:hypothetical protein